MNMGFISRQATEGSEIKAAKALAGRYVEFGPFALDTVRHDLSKNGTRVRIPGKVCQVLLTLLERPGEIVTREELRARLWDSETHVNYEANVNTTVNKLRQILGDSNEQSEYVRTIPRKGYSFVGQMEFVERAKAAAGAAAVAPGAEEVEEKAPFWGVALASRVFGANRAGVWFAAGVIALVIAAMLFGAAITLYAHRLL
jgi:DNA-binding winged helix-turn-helix (wHTH) protein